MRGGGMRGEEEGDGMWNGDGMSEQVMRAR
jgi:hypothetical protein